MKGLVPTPEISTSTRPKLIRITIYTLSTSTRPILQGLSPAGRTSRQNELLKLGYEWGESRIIIGYHWKSDVEAARALASAVYARLHASEEFLTDMAAARREFAKLTK